MRYVGWRRIAVLLVVAAALTVFAKVAARQQDSADGGFPPALQAAVTEVFQGQSCLTYATAESALRARLAGSGYASWAITRGGGVSSDGCVSAGIDLVRHVLVLIPASRLEVREALKEIRGELLRTCLQRDAAIEHLRVVLRNLGEPEPEVRTDGPITIPVAGADEAKRHVEAGCYVYSGVIWTAAGEPVYFLGGK
jgi:hypothetical protein